MKKYFVVMILLAAVLCTGCRKGVSGLNPSSQDQESAVSSLAGTEPSSAETTRPGAPSGGKASAAAPTRFDKQPENKMDCNALIQTKYPEQELFRHIGPAPRVDEFIKLAGYNLSLGMLSEQYPIECLRKMDDGRYYVVYKTDSGGVFYVFFKDFGSNQFYTHCFYWPPATGEAAYTDLHEVSFEEAAKQDEIAQMYTKDAPMNMLFTDDTHFVTLHPTPSGFTKIVYELCDGSIDGADTDSILKSTFNVHVEQNAGFVIPFGGQDFDYSILSGDIPH